MHSRPWCLDHACFCPGHTNLFHSYAVAVPLHLQPSIAHVLQTTNTSFDQIPPHYRKMPTISFACYEAGTIMLDCVFFCVLLYFFGGRQPPRLLPFRARAAHCTAAVTADDSSTCIPPTPPPKVDSRGLLAFLMEIPAPSMPVGGAEPLGRLN